MTTILSIFGTRPEAIKLAPVFWALARRPLYVRSRICVTAQHRDMLDQMLDGLAISPHHDLDVMTAGQSPTRVAARVLERLEPVLRTERPDWVVVQGDTTTTLAAALAAKYGQARLAHVEAGLRTFDPRQPFPEEINRQAVAQLADLHFAPTPTARVNLIREGARPETIHVTGNTGIDALQWTLERLDYQRNGHPWDRVAPGRRIILLTAHRRENHGKPLAEICHAVRTIADGHTDDVEIFYPVHPSGPVGRTARRILGALPNVHLLEPLDHPQLVQLMVRAALVITDSGGLQEEAPHLGKPVLVLRHVTERPEAVAAGAARLVGCNGDRIVSEARRLLDDPVHYARMARPAVVFGDGRAAERIAAILSGEPATDWAPGPAASAPSPANMGRG